MTTLRELLEEEKKELDKFNLKVAKFRDKYGMPLGMVHLYGEMGRFCRVLLELEDGLDRVERWKASITRLFKIIEEKIK